MSNLQAIPSVDQLLQTQSALDLIAVYGRPLTLNALRLALVEVRARLIADPQAAAPKNDLILADAESRLTAWTKPTLRPVINATGVILHTNLGRRFPPVANGR